MMKLLQVSLASHNLNSFSKHFKIHLGMIFGKANIKYYVELKRFVIQLMVKRIYQLLLQGLQLPVQNLKLNRHLAKEISK